MKFENVNSIQLVYSRLGNGVPLVLLHGYPLDHTIWDDVLPLLQDEFDIILPDLRGLGKSKVVTSRYTISDLATDIVGLLDKLNIEKAAIAGHSMGGYVSLAFARAYKERMLSLGLISSQAVADSPENKKIRSQMAEKIRSSGVEPIAETFPSKLTPDPRVQAIVRNVISKQKSEGLAGALLAMADREDATAALSSYDFPVVIVHGRADELIPIERAKEIKAAIPHATYIEIPNIGHMPMLEKPQTTASALKRLVRLG